MKNKVKRGDSLTRTAPAGGVISGNAYLIGAQLIVAASTVAATWPFEGEARGVFTLPKATGSAWTEGQLLYWDNTAKNVTTVSTSNTRIGCADAAALAGDTTGQVYLTGIPAPTGA